MQNFVNVSTAARLLTDRMGRVVRPRDISDAFYSRRLDESICPIVGRSRIIPADYLGVIEQTLQAGSRQEVAAHG